MKKYYLSFLFVLVISFDIYAQKLSLIELVNKTYGQETLGTETYFRTKPMFCLETNPWDGTDLPISIDLSSYLI